MRAIAGPAEARPESRRGEQGGRAEAWTGEGVAATIKTEPTDRAEQMRALYKRVSGKASIRPEGVAGE